MNRCILFLLLGAFFVHLLNASDTSKQQEAINRVEQAVAKTNIFELPSFGMKANVQIENKGRLVDGTYQLMWNGSDQWREEINFPSYSEVQVGGKGVVWVQRSTDFIPFRIYELHLALGFGSTVGAQSPTSLVRMPIRPGDRVKKTLERKVRGEKLTCFEIEDDQKYSHEFCMNNSNDTLARNSSDHLDGDLQPVGGKVFPRSMTFLQDGKTVVKVSVTELTTQANFTENAFTPPDGVSPQPGCMNPVPPKLVKRRNPSYPPNARAQRIQGTVAVYVWIGTDGVPEIRKVVENPNSDLTTASLNAIEGWHYQPAQCSDQPVRVETILQINYTLSF
jgi:TonB family protein